MLTVLGGLAEFERELIRARTGEGRERAKAKGVKMGRKPKLTDHQKREAIKRGAVAICVGIDFGAISSMMRLADHAARSIV
jgi:DNA invertase Pin-like site-specific DNA recombinase